MPDAIDTLQIKIDQAKAKLPAITLNAINAVDWRASILSLREKLSYSFEQLSDLEIETELVLCGLLTPENYPKELKSRMKISDMQVNELVNEMNVLVFSRIKEELIKTTEGKKVPEVREELAPVKINIIKPDTEAQKKSNADILGSHGIEIIPTQNGFRPAEKPVASPTSPIFASKLSGSFQIPSVKTEHTLDNITKTGATPAPVVDMKPKIPKADPYREIPE